MAVKAKWHGTTVWIFGKERHPSFSRQILSGKWHIIAKLCLKLLTKERKAEFSWSSGSAGDLLNIPNQEISSVWSFKNKQIILRSWVHDFTDCA